MLATSFVRARIAQTMRQIIVWVAVTFSCAGCSSPSRPSDSSNAAGTGGASAGGPSASGGTAGTAVAGGGGGSAGGSAGAGGMAPACNQVKLDAPDFVISFVAGSSPEPKGGPITDGTYFYSRFITYGFAGSDTVAGRGKIVLAGSDWEAVEDNDATAEDDINPSHSWSATLATSGTGYILTQICPKPDTISGGYTAEGDTLTLYSLDGGVMFAEELKRQ